MVAEPDGEVYRGGAFDEPSLLGSSARSIGVLIRVRLCRFRFLSRTTYQTPNAMQMRMTIPPTTPPAMAAIGVDLGSELFVVPSGSRFDVEEPSGDFWGVDELGSAADGLYPVERKVEDADREANNGDDDNENEDNDDDNDDNDEAEVEGEGDEGRLLLTALAVPLAASAVCDGG